jgi:hypothetical protein
LLLPGRTQSTRRCKRPHIPSPPCASAHHAKQMLAGQKEQPSYRTKSSAPHSLRWVHFHAQVATLLSWNCIRERAQKRNSSRRTGGEKILFLKSAWQCGPFHQRRLIQVVIKGFS